MRLRLRLRESEEKRSARIDWDLSFKIGAAFSLSRETHPITFQFHHRMSMVSSYHHHTHVLPYFLSDHVMSMYYVSYVMLCHVMVPLLVYDLFLAHFDQYTWHDYLIHINTIKFNRILKFNLKVMQYVLLKNNE